MYCMPWIQQGLGIFQPTDVVVHSTRYIARNIPSQEASWHSISTPVQKAAVQVSNPASKYSGLASEGDGRGIGNKGLPHSF
jgi:hypothetical protein